MPYVDRTTWIIKIQSPNSPIPMATFHTELPADIAARALGDVIMNLPTGAITVVVHTIDGTSYARPKNPTPEEEWGTFISVNATMAVSDGPRLMAYLAQLS